MCVMILFPSFKIRLLQNMRSKKFWFLRFCIWNVSPSFVWAATSHDPKLKRPSLSFSRKKKKRFSKKHLSFEGHKTNFKRSIHKRRRRKICLGLAQKATQQINSINKIGKIAWKSLLLLWENLDKDFINFAHPTAQDLYKLSTLEKLRPKRWSSSWLAYEIDLLCWSTNLVAKGQCQEELLLYIDG